jgi:hypothetical protein
MLRLPAILLIGIAGCHRSLDRPIHFVIPNGFRGPFVIVSNPAYPNAIAKYPDRYEIRVPSDGVIRTKRIDVFYRWHRLSASYKNGTDLPRWESRDNLLQSGPTATSGDNSSLSWYYVGDYDEFQVFMRGDLPGQSA